MRHMSSQTKTLGTTRGRTKMKMLIIPKGISKYGYQKWHYMTYDGKISLISPSIVSMYFWEIQCLEGNLLEDIERFDTKKDAENRIKEIFKRGGENGRKN